MKLELSQAQINQILNALAQQPYIEVHELIHSIQQQAQSQLQVNGSHVPNEPLKVPLEDE